MNLYELARQFRSGNPEGWADTVEHVMATSITSEIVGCVLVALAIVALALLGVSVWKKWDCDWLGLRPILMAAVSLLLLAGITVGLAGFQNLRQPAWVAMYDVSRQVFPNRAR